jgi:predicted MFS family arabinose efflux permease
MTRSKIHYAWIVVTITFLVLLVAGGVRTAPSVLIKPLEQEFGWTRANISFAIAVSILWFGLGGPLAGMFVNRFGLRRMMTGGLILVAIGLGAMLTIQEIWQLHLFWGVLVGVGTGALANVLGAIVAQRWFNKHRGLIVGVMGAASAAGQLIFLPTMISLTALGGWRGAMQIVAIVIAAVIIPVVWLMREYPQDKNLKPYGDDGSTPTLAEITDASRQTSLSSATRTLDFWLLAGSFFVCGYTTNGLIGTHLLPHAMEHGFASNVAANAIVLMGLMNIVGTLASGWFTDRYDNRLLLAIYYTFRAGSIAFLPFIHEMSGLFIFAFVYGLDWIATVPPTINLTAQRFGRASVGVLYGWIFFSHMVGAAVAAYLGGVMRDTFGDYTIAFFTAAVLGFIAAGFSMTIKRQQPVLAKATD